MAAALLLSQQGYRVTVYEAKDSLELGTENSYPIGVNLRGQAALERIDPPLLDTLREHAEVVASFSIYSGRRRIASLESGSILATTRAFLTTILYERALQADRVTVHLGHKLLRADLAERTLRFARSSGGEVTVDARDARVIAADGVWSMARRSMEQQVPGFTPTVGDWGVQFRVAYSQPYAAARGLDPSIHHIFTPKGLYTATLSDGVWCLALTAIHGDDAEDLLLSTDPSEENIRAVQAFVAENAPLAAPLFTPDDYASYFSRTTFRGAVVICPRLAFDEWLLLIGDAAHSVLPPTGEGVNSGLEDCSLLADQASTGSSTWFADFEAGRLPDLSALGQYAWALKENISASDPARTAANVVVRVVDAIATSLRLPSARVESRLFGPDAGRTPYRDAIGPWLRQRRALYPVAYAATSVVVTVGKALRRSSKPSATSALPPMERAHGLRITVIGGSRGTGRALAELARDRGNTVTVASRSGSDLDGVRTVTGDATSPEVVRQAVAGADAVIVCVGGSAGSRYPRTEVTHAVIEAMRELGVERLVVQTSLAAGDSARQLPFPADRIMPVLLAKPLADHDAQEDLVRNSGLRWTIVRPAGLTDQPRTDRWRVLRHDEPGKLGGRVTRADVADCILWALADDSSVGAQLGLSGT